MYQALYRKYRPKSLSDVAGQSVIINTLKNSIKNNKISHAYLFAGPRGTGKTSIAKAFAKTINCSSVNNSEPCNKCISCKQINLKQNTDIIEIDAASNNGVDEIREIRNKVLLSPTYGKYKIYIIDEVHMLTMGAFNALLKTLEEPPAHVIFILATTEPHKIPVTILSRCQRFDFKKISINDIVERLKYICKEENILIKADALHEIASISDGGMRDSINLLDQVSSYVDVEETITLDHIHEVSGTLDLQSTIQFVNNLLNFDMHNVLFLLQEYDDKGINIKKFTEKIMDILEKKVVSKETPEYLKTIVNDVTLYESLPNMTNNTLLECIEILIDSLPNISSSTNPKLLLELSLIKIMDLIKSEVLDSNNMNEKVADVITKNDNAYNLHKPGFNNKTLANKEKVFSDEMLCEFIIKNEELYKKFKDQRINNTLAKLNKKQISEVKEKIEDLKSYIVTSNYGQYISMFIDSQIKATSDECIIFVFSEKSISDSFNEHIPILEKIYNSVTLDNRKMISTSIKEWDKIKNEFNSKQRQYIYDLETISETDIYEKKTNSTNEIQDKFSDCIEYI
ncbi:MAG: DNA polymerase III subunit gamma/tau [Clostridium sp.]|nr:DNA polymerase III subunit gamma/tau [Clostridium sp.]MCM1443777.1 DNA polymerase III subunit gamma/tau [Candidatus Amulumruptor caecigallinarius]